MTRKELRVKIEKLREKALNIEVTTQAIKPLYVFLLTTEDMWDSNETFCKNFAVCGNCGNDIDIYDEFCASCGIRIDWRGVVERNEHVSSYRELGEYEIG